MKWLIIVLLVVCIGFPLGYAWRLWRLDEASRGAWLAVAADATVFVSLVFIIGRWDIAGYYTRYLLVAAFAVCLVRSLLRHARRPWRTGDRPVWRSHWTTLASLAVFGAALAHVVSGLLPRQEARELAFPLTGGRFMVAQGGGVTLLNHHASHRQQRHAADIDAINAAGFRAAGVLPRDLGRYAVYGASVVSPCAGEVVSARDGLPDLVPPQMDPENPAGNHVVIDCGDIHVELAHLRQGSVAVKAGDRLQAGEAVGEVGNSGNTTEPHLHIHAFDPVTGAGVPMSFAGRMPVRNRLFRN